MSKKYLIIMIAACALCLGAGVIIGGGLNQTNLFATGAGSAKAIEDLIASGADVDSMTLALSGMESQLQGYAQRVQNMNQRNKQARTTLAEIREMISEGSLVMSEDICGSLRDMIEAGKDDEVYEAIYRGLRELEATLSFKAGDALSAAQWEAIKAEVEDIVSSLGNASDLAQFDLQKVYQDYQQAVNTLAAVMKQQYDDSMRIISDLRG